MTCIVGLKHKGKVYMGADSATGGTWGTWQNGPCKLFKKDGLLIGVAGCPRAQQIIRHGKALPTPKRRLSADAADEYVFNVSNAFMEALLEHKHATVENAKPEFESTFMIAFGRHLYTIHSNFQYVRLDEPYRVIGFPEYAEGSLYSTVGMEPEKRIRLALEAEATHHHYVKPPFHILTT